MADAGTVGTSRRRDRRGFVDPRPTWCDALTDISIGWLSAGETDSGARECGPRLSIEHGSGAPVDHDVGDVVRGNKSGSKGPIQRTSLQIVSSRLLLRNRTITLFLIAIDLVDDDREILRDATHRRV